MFTINFWFRQRKNFKNRPTFAKVTVKIKVAQFFMVHSVWTYNRHLQFTRWGNPFQKTPEAKIFLTHIVSVCCAAFAWSCGGHVRRLRSQIKVHGLQIKKIYPTTDAHDEVTNTLYCLTSQTCEQRLHNLRETSYCLCSSLRKVVDATLSERFRQRRKCT